MVFLIDFMTSTKQRRYFNAMMSLKHNIYIYI